MIKLPHTAKLKETWIRSGLRISTGSYRVRHARRTAVPDRSFANVERCFPRSMSLRRIASDGVCKRMPTRCSPSCTSPWKTNLTRTSTGGTTDACKSSQHWKRSKQLGYEGCGHRWKKMNKSARGTKKTVLRKVVLSPNKHWRKYYNPHKGTSSIKFGISAEAHKGRARQR